MTDEQLLNKLNAIAREVGNAGKRGIGAENIRASLVAEAHRRGLLGMKSKLKHRTKR